MPNCPAFLFRFTERVESFYRLNNGNFDIEVGHVVEDVVDLVLRGFHGFCEFIRYEYFFHFKLPLSGP